MTGQLKFSGHHLILSLPILASSVFLFSCASKNHCIVDSIDEGWMEIEFRYKENVFSVIAKIPENQKVIEGGKCPEKINGEINVWNQLPKHPQQR